VSAATTTAGTAGATGAGSAPPAVPGLAVEPARGPAGAMLRELARVVLPPDADDDVLPLYVDGELRAVAGPSGSGGSAPSQYTSAGQQADQVLGRRRYRVPAGTRTSFATYFNAFPAGYWRRWTVVTAVTLQVRTSGDGTLVVYRSNAKGNAQRVDSRVLEAGEVASTFTLPLKPFNDGGWYWFDLVGGAGDLVLEEAAWHAAAYADGHAAAAAGTATVSITTFDRPDYCSALLRTLGDAPELAGVVDQVLVVDQGSRKVVDDTEHYPAAAQALGGRLRVIDQGNLGGSGGFSRGMVETVAAGVSSYVLLLDDDVRVEPEGIARAVVFADLARTPTVVGGHMFSMYQRSLLHALGEKVQRWRFWWGPVDNTAEDHDLAQGNLRATPWLHRRVDVDYNGWWMCLIPTAVIRSIGASLPLFIKWDDAEYGLRAAEADVPTVSLPGMAVWHVPWTDKDDAVDWQAYFHARNRVVAALLHSPYDRGGNVTRESFSIQVKHLLSMQYSTAELRLMALEDALAGWEQLHADLPGKLAQVRALRASFADSTYRPDAAAYPRTRRRKPPRKGKEFEVPTGRAGILAAAAGGVVKQLRGVDALAARHPQADVAHMDARWWVLSRFDSALVSSADGTGVAWYKRDPRRFAALLRRSVVVHQRLLREWPELARSYRAGLEGLASVEAWRGSLGLDAARPS
jgi:galactofuranosylgalactofuranosylrhamnosyl-N-acetylglucosaminyl-diphospho-decaprenol beta-1,5/1,6-galactofuranosyltransferase